jgi:hypothetical protein
MTITRRADGVWELRTREGQLVGAGDLHTIVTLWARTRRQGWSTVPFGQPMQGNGAARTVECTRCHDCQCRACARPDNIR